MLHSMVWGRAGNHRGEQAIPIHTCINNILLVGSAKEKSWFLARRDLLSKAKVAVATILSNEKRNVLEVHCSMTPRMFDNIGLVMRRV